MQCSVLMLQNAFYVWHLQGWPRNLWPPPGIRGPSPWSPRTPSSRVARWPPVLHIIEPINGRLKWKRGNQSRKVSCQTKAFPTGITYINVSEPVKRKKLHNLGSSHKYLLEPSPQCKAMRQCLQVSSWTRLPFGKPGGSPFEYISLEPLPMAKPWDRAHRDLLEPTHWCKASSVHKYLLEPPPYYKAWVQHKKYLIEPSLYYKVMKHRLWVPSISVSYCKVINTVPSISVSYCKVMVTCSPIPYPTF